MIYEMAHKSHKFTFHYEILIIILYYSLTLKLF